MKRRTYNNMLKATKMIAKKVIPGMKQMKLL